MKTHLRTLLIFTLFLSLASCGAKYQEQASSKSQQLLQKARSLAKESAQGTANTTSSKNDLAFRPAMEKQSRPDQPNRATDPLQASICDHSKREASSESPPYLFTLDPTPKYLDAKKYYFVGNMKNGLRHGPYSMYQDSKYHSRDDKGTVWYSGRRLFKGEYINGKRQGMEKEYRAGFLVAIRQYKDDMLNGEAKHFDECGRLFAIEHYQQGEFHGTWNLYWDNGNKRSESNYQNGKNTGVGKAWARNGQLTLDLHKKDHLIIYKKEWFENGNKKTDERPPYKKTWYENGFIESEIIPANATTFGCKRVWYPDGTPMLSVNTDRKGEPVGEIFHWDENGNAVSHKQWARKARDKKYKEYSKIAGRLLMLPVEILIYGLK